MNISIILQVWRGYKMNIREIYPTKELRESVSKLKALKLINECKGDKKQMKMKLNSIYGIMGVKRKC